jgi:ABC-type transporter MlaC component
MKARILGIALAVALGTSYSAIAAPDEAQRYMLQKAMAAKLILKQAQVAAGTQRKNLMLDHMRLMKEVMDKMAVMKPKSGITGPEHEEWMKEHHALMQQILDQMMSEHHLMMETK